MWYTATSASVNTGENIVSINSGDDLALVQESSGLIFEGESPVEVIRSYIDTGGNHKIRLASAWPYASKVNEPLIAYPTDADFAAATAELRRVLNTMEVASLTEAQEGTEDTKIMTSLKTKAAIDFNTGTAAARDFATEPTTDGSLLATTRTIPVPSNIHNRLFSEFTAVNDDPARWNNVSNCNLLAVNNNNALAILLGSPTNNRFGGIQVGHATGNFASVLGTLDLNPLGGPVLVNGNTAFHTGNILGTVSQSGGVPTGAIIESGSNANGSYVKYADGTMIMTRTVLFDFSTQNSEVYSFPVTPVDVDNNYSSISFTNTALTARHQAYASTTCMSSNGWRVANTITTAESINVFLTNISRWY